MSTEETLPLPEFLEQCAKQLAEIDSLRTRLETAEKDKERLDWCEEHSDELWKILHMLLPGEDLRKAIDDARIKVS